MFWRHTLTKDQRLRTIKSRKGGDENRLSINILELLGMVMTAFVIIVARKDTPPRVGEPILMRGIVLRRCSGQLTARAQGRREIGRYCEDVGGVRVDRGMVLPAKTRPEGRERVSRRDNEVKRR